MILSHAKIEEIAAAVIKDFNLFFFGEKASEARSMPQGTPIDQFASEYEEGWNAKQLTLFDDDSISEKILKERKIVWKGN